MKKMTNKQKEFAALAPPFDKATQADRIVGATGKAYNNGQRKSNMYGGGMASPRKPMMMGGLAQQNRTVTTGMASKDNPMGAMTEKKKYDMGMNLGGAIKKFEKKSNGGKAGGVPKTPKQKKFAALADPKDRITLADRIKGATT